MKLRPRQFRFSADRRRRDRKLRGYTLPQRDHLKRPMPPRKKSA